MIFSKNIEKEVKKAVEQCLNPLNQVNENFMQSLLHEQQPFAYCLNPLNQVNENFYNTLSRRYGDVVAS